MDPMNPFASDQSLGGHNDSDPSSGWGSGFSLWEEQCFQEAEESADQERQISSEKDAINQRLWLLFQASACSIAQLYKDRTHSQSMWLPFQTAASNVTTMYRECLESQKKLMELCQQAGAQRRNREILSQLKKRKRGVIRQDELIALICGKHNSRERHDRHHSAGRSPRRVTSERESLSGATPSFFANSTTSHSDHRLHHSRSPNQTFSCLSLSESGIGVSHDANVVDADATDLQPFRDALALSSLTSPATATVASSGGIRRGRNVAHFTTTNPVDLEELNAFMSAEFNRNVDSKKRSHPVNDVVMSSPTHKRPKFL